MPKLFENGTKVRTDECRLSFAHLFTPHAVKEDQRASYNTALLIPKTDTATITLVEQAIENAKQTGIDKKGWKPSVFSHPKFHNPLRDGDDERPDDEAYGGMAYVNAKSYTTQPVIMDIKKNKITDEAQVYSGCWVIASISFYPFDVSGNRGIACGLNGIQKVRDDEALSGAGNVVGDFEYEDEDDDFLN